MAETRSLTVAICTRDRARFLRGSLESLAAAAPPLRLPWEVLVVLNACTDDSAAVVESFAARLPVRAVIEPEPGVSKARNRAVENAAGDFVLWTDDDVVVAKDWLRTYEAAFARWPETVVFGGKVIARAEAPVAPWFQDVLPAVGSVFAHLPLEGFEDGQSMPPRVLFPFGPNFAVRTEVQRRYLFHPDLGRLPGKYLRNHEETEMLISVLDDGYEGRWLPSAGVEHLVPRERQTAAHIRAYCLGNGIVSGLSVRSADARGRYRGILSESAAVVMAELRFRAATLSGSRERWARRLRKASYARGRWIGRYGPRPYATPSGFDVP